MAGKSKAGRRVLAGGRGGRASEDVGLGIQIAPVDALRPSAYNPRKADPERLRIVELSLRKLGWLLPIYADAGGEILSGHQRHYVAIKMGAKAVPVIYVTGLGLEARQAVNLAFNRGTNDMGRESLPDEMAAALKALKIERLAKSLPDLDIDSPAWTPCLAARLEPLGKFIRACEGKWNAHGKIISKTLAQKGVIMPLVATEAGEVVNGVGRLEYLAEAGVDRWWVVRVPNKEGELARGLLNLLSMDFAVHEKYADILRHHSFRRSSGKRSSLGLGFTWPLIGSKAGYEFNLADAKTAARWVALHGRTVLDFGCGHNTDAKLLATIGVDAVGFEPYRLAGSDEIYREGSVAFNRTFLERVAAGVEFDSIFLASVLNSVPFREDRLQVVRIVAGLSGPRTKVYACAASIRRPSARLIAGEDIHSAGHGVGSLFRLNYEPNLSISTNDLFKVQKHHNRQEFFDLWAEAFERVNVKNGPANLVCAACQTPIVTGPQLRAALEFEFELPYPDGQRMGLSGEAIKAFRARGKRFKLPWAKEF